MSDKQLFLVSVPRSAPTPEEPKSAPASSARTVNVCFRCSEAEYEMIRKGAEEDGQVVSSWLRDLVARRVEEQAAGISAAMAPAIFPLAKSLRDVIADEVERRTKP